MNVDVNGDLFLHVAMWRAIVKCEVKGTVVLFITSVIREQGQV